MVFISLRLYFIININGFNLKLENMTNDDIKVTGKIDSMEIERTIDES